MLLWEHNIEHKRLSSFFASDSPSHNGKGFDKRHYISKYYVICAINSDLSPSPKDDGHIEVNFSPKDKL